MTTLTCPIPAMTDAELDVEYLRLLGELHQLDIIPFDAEARRHFHYERGKCEDALFDLKMEMFRRERYRIQPPTPTAW